MATRPVIIATWPFGIAACQEGWKRLIAGASALDAVEAAANVTEEDPRVSSVGYGGLPNAAGVVELDAAIMDGPTHAAGSVAGLTGIRRPISVARRVMERTPHVLLVGENARQFALREGFPPADLLTEASRASWLQWRKEHGGPDVAHFDPGPTGGVPTSPLPDKDAEQGSLSPTAKRAAPVRASRRALERGIGGEGLTPDDHDTIGLCVLDTQGNLAVGCTTSGMAWKVPGRVGDSPIIGSGLYVDNAVGSAAATGHGDEIMKACLSYRAVMRMEEGRTPQEACEEALRYLLRKRPPEQHGQYGAALIAVRKDGLIGAAASRSGFRAPDRLWQWAIAQGSGAGGQGPDIALNEGAYVTLDAVVPTLAG